ncbi:MAG: bifunctional phosphoglucose/phosphomannose isomerase [Ignavibacterium sp.]
MELKKLISKYDTQNQFNVLKETYKQIEFSWNNKINLGNLIGKKFNQIVISGLGGSAISGELMQNFLVEDLSIPIFINRNYHLPNFANENTLFIASSYSGNTEETIEAFNKALKKGCSLVSLTTGGKLEELSNLNNIPIIKLKSGYQPRYALGTSFFSLLKVFQELKIISNHNDFVLNLIEIWKSKGEKYSSENSLAVNYAELLIGFVPVIYSVQDYTNAIGNRFKAQLNENSKIHAFQNSYPELNHNEIIGWENFDEFQLQAKVINIVDEIYHPQIKKRFSITSELIQNKGVDIIELSSDGSSFKERLLDLVYLIDWITFYTAILREKDPSEIDYINLLKKKLVE